jgi:transposase
MFGVELYGRVRRSVLVEGRSQREVAREFGISRKTIQKMLRYAVPPGYQRLQPVKRPKLGPWLGVIDAMLEDDRQRPVKQRHTAKRIFDRLREEHGFGGGNTIVKDYVRRATLRGREMFVPLTHAAGEAQVDFGEALVVVAGVERKAHYLVMDLPHSDDCFVGSRRSLKSPSNQCSTQEHSSNCFRSGVMSAFHSTPSIHLATTSHPK